MTDVMMMLGLEYQFSLSSSAYQQLRRSTEYRWPVQERLRRRPARQFVGPGNDAIELSGTIYPHYRGGLRQMECMRAVAGQGEPLRLVGRTGEYPGDGGALNGSRRRRRCSFGTGIPAASSFISA